VPSDVFATIVTPLGTTRKSYNSGYRIVIPECPPNPETKPPVKVRIGREFERSGHLTVFDLVRCISPCTSVRSASAAVCVRPCTVLLSALSAISSEAK